MSQARAEVGQRRRPSSCLLFTLCSTVHVTGLLHRFVLAQAGFTMPPMQMNHGRSAYAST